MVVFLTGQYWQPKKRREGNSGLPNITANPAYRCRVTSLRQSRLILFEASPTHENTSFRFHVS